MFQRVATTPFLQWGFAILLFFSLASNLAAQPTFSKTFSPTTVGLGNVSTLRFTISNTDPANVVTSLAFSDNLPLGMSIADPANSAATCGGTISALPGATTITLTDGMLGSNSSCFISVDVMAAVPGLLMNISGDLTSSQGNSGTASANLTIDPTLLSFSKSFSPPSVSLGQRSTITFTIDNSDNGDGQPQRRSIALVAGLNFIDNLPVGMVVADPPTITNTCVAGGFTGGTITAIPGSSVIILGSSSIVDTPAVAALGTCTITVEVIATGIGRLDNVTETLQSATVSSFPFLNPITADGKASATLEVTVDPIALSKAFVDDPTPPGSATTLEFTIRNFDRGFSATNISFTDDLNATLGGLSVSTSLPLIDPCGTGSLLSESAGILSFTGGSLGANGVCTFSVSLNVPASAAIGVHPNTTSAVTGDIDGTMIIGNPAADDLFVAEAPLLTKTFLTNPVGAGSSVELEFTITNTSPTSMATAITFTDTFDSILPTASAIPADGFCGMGSMATHTPLINPPPPDGVIPAILTVTGANLAAGASCTFSIMVDVAVGSAVGPYPNTTSTITATVGGVSTTGLAATDNLQVVAAPSLRKEFTDDPVDPGATVTLEFTLSHDALAPADAVGVAFSDDLDAALVGLVATSLPLNDVCGTGNGTLSGTGVLSFSGATLTPGQVCTFSVTLQVPAGATTGSHTNTTSTVTATVSGLAVTENPAADDLIITGLQFSKEFTDDPVLPGGTVTLQFTLDNTGTQDAINMFFIDNVDDTLPGLIYNGGAVNNICGAGSQIAGPTLLTFVGGSLLAGTSCTFSLTLDVPVAASNSYINTTTSLLATIDGSLLTLGTATDALVVNGELVALSKTFTDDPVAPGNTVTLEFTLDNLDPSQTVTGISFTDDLNATLSGLVATGLPVSNICGAGSMLTGTNLLSFTGGALAGGTSCTFSVTLTVPAMVITDTATNTTSAVSGLVGMLAVTGEAASDDLLLQTTAFSKAFDGPVGAGGTPQLSFTINNLDTANAVSDLAFNDDLDATLSGLVTTGLPTDPCGVGSVLSGTSVLAFTGGALAAGDSCTFSVDLQVPALAAPGTYPNTTSNLSVFGLVVSLPATADLAIEPPPLFSKAFSSVIVGQGLSSTLTFTVDNSAASIAASSLDFTDNLPAGMIVASPANATTTCTSGMLTAPTNDTAISYSGGSVAAGASCTVQVDVSSATTGTFINTSGDLTSFLGNSGTASDTLVVLAPPGFSKVFSPDTIALNGTSTLTFTIDNSSSTIAATSLDFSDNLPTGVIVATPSNATTNCTGGMLSAVAGASVLSYTGGTVAASASCTVQADVSSSAVGSHVNTSGALSSLLGDSGTATDTLIAVAPPGFTKVFAANVITAGGVSTLRFTIDNSANVLAATSLDFSDNLPTGVVINSPSNAATTCTGGVLTAADSTTVIRYSGGSVTAGASCTVQADVTSTTLGIHVNTSGDLSFSLGNSGPATDTLTVTVLPGFSKSFSPAVIAAGSISQLLFTIDNTANSIAATGLTFTDNLPAGVEVASPADATTTCTGGTLSAVAGSMLISYSGGTVAASASCTLQVDVTSFAPGVYNNTSGTLASSLGTSPAALATLTVPLPPTFSKAFSPSDIDAGEPSTLIFTLDNTASSLAAIGVDFSDNLPVNVRITTPANASTTCVGGVLTAVNESLVITYTGGTITAGTSCIVQVNVTSNVVGGHLNTTDVLTSSLGVSGTASDTLHVEDCPFCVNSPGELARTLCPFFTGLLPGVEDSLENSGQLFGSGPWVAAVCSHPGIGE